MISRKLQLWRPVPGYTFKCGLEIHTQLQTKHKLFSLSKNSPDSAPNVNVSFFDAGLPGTFPKLNPEALLLAIKAASVLNSAINPVSSFDRKHYFYLDQPLGYQITQRYRPLAHGGHLELKKEFDEVAENKTIRIEQIQLEQDTAKLNYDAYDGVVNIDLNRANVPLIELVTKPDFDHISQVRAFVKKYIGLMTHLGVCSGDMENGAMRCDVNVSVSGGNRVEIKNLGSTTEVLAAIRYEYQRQIDHLKANKGPIEQETRGWNGKETVRARSKEDAVDYRYFPDIELPVVHLHPSIGEEVFKTLPELPEELITKLTQAPYGLESKHAKFLVENPEIHNYYNDLHKLVVSEKKYPAKVVNNWLFHELLGAFNKLELDLDISAMSPQKFAALIDEVQQKRITFTSAKLLLTQIIQGSDDDKTLSVAELIDKYDLGVPTGIDESELRDAIEDICLEIMQSHPDVVAKVKQGKTKSINFLVGRAMKETQGKVESKQFENCFKTLIDSTS